MVKIADYFKPPTVKIEEEIRQSKFTNINQKALLNLIFTAGWLEGKIKDELKPYGLTSQQYNVLRILRGRYPKCANPTEIKAVMLDKNPDLTRLCDRLIANKWIAREIDTENRRKMKIIITESGLKLLKQLDPVMDKFHEKIKNLSNSEYQTLNDLLDKLRG